MSPKASWTGLTCHIHQYYHCQRLPNTEWSNSRKWTWARDRLLWRETLWEKEGCNRRVDCAIRNVNNRSMIRAWRWRRAGWRRWTRLMKAGWVPLHSVTTNVHSTQRLTKFLWKYTKCYNVVCVVYFLLVQVHHESKTELHPSGSPAQFCSTPARVRRQFYHPQRSKSVVKSGRHKVESSDRRRND